MDTIKKGPDASPRAQAPGRNTRTSVREPQQRSKLLILLFSDYAKLYADHPASLHVVQIPRCDTVEEERAALELAESRVPLGWQHLIDERLLVGSFNPNVPTLSKLAAFEGLAFGLNAIGEAARRSITQKRVERRDRQ